MDATFQIVIEEAVQSRIAFGKVLEEHVVCRGDELRLVSADLEVEYLAPSLRFPVFPVILR